MEKILESEVLIRFPDCDPFNHLNNSRYLDYFMNAREDHLLQFYKFSIYEYVAKNKAGWVVGQSQIAYFRPALLMETVVIQTTIRELDEKDLLVEMSMLNKEKTSLKSLLWSKFYHIDLVSQKKIPHTAELMDFFKPVVDELPGITSFEQRLAHLRTSSKEPTKT